MYDLAMKYSTFTSKCRLDTIFYLIYTCHFILESVSKSGFTCTYQAWHLPILPSLCSYKIPQSRNLLKQLFSSFTIFWSFYGKLVSMMMRRFLQRGLLELACPTLNTLLQRKARLVVCHSADSIWFHNRFIS